MTKSTPAKIRKSRRRPKVPVLVEFIRHDPFRSGQWFRLSDGREVHEYVSGGHIWRHTSAMTGTCVFCQALYENLADPSWEKCPNRTPPHDTPPATKREF